MRIVVALTGASVLAMASGSAHAYLDPGTGSVLLQVLLGGIATAAIVLKRYWQELRRLLGIGRRDRRGPGEPPESGP